MKGPFNPSKLLATLFFATSSAWAFQAPAWGPWRDLEQGIAVDFAQVTKDTCTWGFKNTSTSQTLRSMTFTFTYPSPNQPVYNPYVTTTGKDILPRPLQPGESIGGWSAYTAQASCVNVSISVTAREWGTGIASASSNSNTWTDAGSGLTWNKSDNGSDVTWQQAVSYCQSQQARLPTIDELQAIFSQSINTPGQCCGGHAVVFHAKGNIQLSGWEWSSTPGYTNAQAWYFYFVQNGGKVAAPLSKNTDGRALCVRR